MIPEDKLDADKLRTHGDIDGDPEPSLIVFCLVIAAMVGVMLLV